MDYYSEHTHTHPSILLRQITKLFIKYFVPSFCCGRKGTYKAHKMTKLHSPFSFLKETITVLQDQFIHRLMLSTELQLLGCFNKHRTDWLPSLLSRQKCFVSTPFCFQRNWQPQDLHRTFPGSVLANIFTKLGSGRMKKLAGYSNPLRYECPKIFSGQAFSCSA